MSRRASPFFLPALLGALLYANACNDEPDQTFPDATGGGFVDSGVPRDATAPAPDATIEPDAGEPEADATAEPDAETSPDADIFPDAMVTPPFPIQIAYSANAEEILIQNLYLTDTSTSRRQIHPTLAGGSAGGEKQPETGGIQSFRWSRQGERIFYEAEQELFDVSDLYVAEVPGAYATPPRKITAVEGTNGAQLEALSHNSALTIFQQAANTNTSRLFVVDPTEEPMNVRQVSQGLATTNAWSPNADQLVFLDIVVSASDRGFWYADLAADPLMPVRAHPDHDFGTNGALSWAPDGTSFVFTADPVANRRFELFRVTVTNGLPSAPERMHDPLPAFGRVQEAAFSPDGTRVAYSASARIDRLRELYVIDVSGMVPSAPVAVSPMSATGEGVERFSWNKNADRLIYLAGRENFSGLELFLADPTGVTPAVMLNPPIATSGAVRQEHFVRSGEGVVFSVDDANTHEIFAVDFSAATPSAPVRVNHAFGVDDKLYAWELSPDERTVIYSVVGPLVPWAVYTVDVSTFPPGAPVLMSSGEVEPAWCFKNSGELALAADLETGGTGGLFLARNPHLAAFDKISGPILDGGRVFRCAFPPR